jgi:hypothetical protein
MNSIPLDMLYVIIQYYDKSNYRLINKFSKNIYDGHYDRKLYYGMYQLSLNEHSMKDCDPVMLTNLINKLDQQLRANLWRNRHKGYILDNIKNTLHTNYSEYYDRYPIMKKYITGLHYDHSEIELVDGVKSRVKRRYKFGISNEYDSLVSDLGTLETIHVRYTKSAGFDGIQIKADANISPIIVILSFILCIITNMVVAQVYQNLPHLYREFYRYVDRVIDPLKDYILKNKEVLYDFIKNVKPFSKIDMVYRDGDIKELDLDEMIMDMFDK